MTIRRTILAALLLTCLVSAVADAQLSTVAPAMPAATVEAAMQELARAPVTVGLAREWGWNIACAIGASAAGIVAAGWALILAFVKPYIGGINADLAILRETTAAHGEKFGTIERTVANMDATADARMAAIARLQDQNAELGNAVHKMGAKLDKVETHTDQLRTEVAGAIKVAFDSRNAAAEATHTVTETAKQVLGGTQPYWDPTEIAPMRKVSQQLHAVRSETAIKATQRTATGTTDENAKPKGRK